MAEYRKYYGPKIGVKFFPEEKIIYLEPKRGMRPNDLRKIKEKMETYLNIDSSNFYRIKGAPAFSIKLAKETQETSVDQLLKGLFHGGEEVLDAADLSKEEEDEESPQTQPAQPQQPPQPQLTPQPESPLLPTESKLINLYNTLLESTYRTASYWGILTKAAGVENKQKITEKDIFRIRKQFSQRAKSRSRDDILRAADKAMNYFARKIRKLEGEAQSQQFKEKYRSIGHLVPSDYAEQKDTKTQLDQPIDLQNTEITVDDERKLSDKQFEDILKLTDFFSTQEKTDEEDAYENFNVKE